MRSTTILTSLALKLYFSHNRLQSECNQIINANLDEVLVECSRNCNFSDIPEKQKTWVRTWVDTVFEQYKQRNIPVERNTIFLEGITNNQTIMDHAARYSTLKIVKGKINQVRRYKQVLLPLELFGTCGKKQTSCATDKCI